MTKKFTFILCSPLNKVKLTSYGITKICRIRRKKKTKQRNFCSDQKTLYNCFFCLFLIFSLSSLGARPTHTPPCLERRCNIFSSESSSKISLNSFDHSVSPLKKEDLTAARQFLEELQNKTSPQTEEISEVVLSVSNGNNNIIPPPPQGIKLGQTHCAGCLSNQRTQTHSLNSDSHLIVFVSFSLGDATLQKLFQDIQKVGGRLVMKGLYKNSFRMTQKKIQDLKIVVDIDPPLFDNFHVQKVPSFIISKNLEAEGMPPHDLLKGNVSLFYALETFEQAGNKEAKHFLKKLTGTYHD